MKPEDGEEQKKKIRFSVVPVVPVVPWHLTCGFCLLITSAGAVPGPGPTSAGLVTASLLAEITRAVRWA